jgi:hypothetical protein
MKVIPETGKSPCHTQLDSIIVITSIRKSLKIPMEKAMEI